MDTTACIESATRAGIMREALPDALNRATSHFAGVQPSQDALDTYYQQTLRDLAPHFWPPVVTKAPPAPALDPQQRFGVPAEVWAKMSPEDRYTMRVVASRLSSASGPRSSRCGRSRSPNWRG